MRSVPGSPVHPFCQSIQTFRMNLLARSRKQFIGILTHDVCDPLVRCVHPRKIPCLCLHYPEDGTIRDCTEFIRLKRR
jgi:hypothetical protein